MLKPRARKKNGGKVLILQKMNVMEKNYGVVELTQDELKQQNGGLFFSPLLIFDPKDAFAFFRGLRDAWIKSTQF